MYEFYYNFLKKKCKYVKLLYTDTDSLILEITDENLDDIMFENKQFLFQLFILKIVNIIGVILKKHQAKWKMNMVEHLL